MEDNSWNMHQDSQLDAIELVGEIKVLFEDYYNRIIDASDLKQRLISLLFEVVETKRAVSVVEAVSYLDEATPYQTQWRLRSSSSLLEPETLAAY